MQVLYNNDRLKGLLRSLHELTDIWANFFDAEGRDMHVCGQENDFCRRINADPEGHARCVACDVAAAKHCAELRGEYNYRCHAGLRETILPVFDKGEIVAYMIFGQYLDETPIEQQWENTRRCLADWYMGDIDAQRAAFYKLRQLSAEKCAAYADILGALTSYIQLKGVIRAAELSDTQRLEMYINDHFAEKLSLARVSQALGVGTTKLCALAKKLSGGKTLTRMIAERRVEEAKKLLIGGDLSISAVAVQVGFDDYNYFTKTFKAVTGMTPTAWRRHGGQSAPHTAE